MDKNGYLQAPEQLLENAISKDPSARWLQTEPLLNLEAYAEVFADVRSNSRWLREAGKESGITDFATDSTDSLGEAPLDEPFSEGPSTTSGPPSTPSQISSSLTLRRARSKGKGKAKGKAKAVAISLVEEVSESLVYDVTEMIRSQFAESDVLVGTVAAQINAEMDGVRDYLERLKNHLKKYIASEMRVEGEQIIETMLQSTNEARVPSDL